MKNLIIPSVLAMLLCVVLSGCTEPDYFTATVTPTISSLTVANGEYLEITKVEVTNATITHGDDGTPEAVNDFTVDRVEFFIGNVKVGSTSNKPYSFKYKIENLLVGTHELRVDAVISDIPKRVWRDKDEAKNPTGRFSKGKHGARIGVTSPLQVIDSQND